MSQVHEAFEVFQPVYERNEQSILGQQLVMTPWMLLDRLKECQETARALRKRIHLGQEDNVHVECPARFVRQLETLNSEIDHTLLLLWRGGLWVENGLEKEVATNGRRYKVVREPFTNGKSFGKSLPTDTPSWQLELLGVDEF